MALVQAPALSLEASGKLGGAIVFSKWKGRPYVRALVKPSNPKSGGQVGVRSMFKFLAQYWASLPAGSKATWENRADQKVVSPFNAYMGYNQFRWRDFTAPTQVDPYNPIGTPGVMGATTATPGVRSVTLEMIVTTPNDIWGVAIFRTDGTGFTTAFDNCIAVVPYLSATPIVYIDSPLSPDTYYYNYREFTVDGQLAAELGEDSAIVT